MKFSNGISKTIPAILAALVVAPIAHADPQGVDTSRDRYQDQVDPNKLRQEVERSSSPRETNLPSDEAATSGTKNQLDERLTEEYLLKHPDELEQNIIVALRAMHPGALEHFISIYKKIPASRRDDSAIMWGEAIIALFNNEMDKSIKIYRELLSLLPQNRTIRFQLAAALFKDQQYDAAKDQFEKLRADSSLGEQDKDVVNKYLDAIANKDKWSFDGGLQYAWEKNVNNAPPAGTKYPGANGGAITSSNEPIEGRGVTYSLGASKKWVFDNRMFTTFSASLWGTRYWNREAHGYSNLGYKISAGFGKETNRYFWSVKPFFQKKYDGFGEKDSNRLHPYYRTIGISAQTNYWFNNKLRGSLGGEYGYDTYVEKSNANTGGYVSAMGSLYYFPKQTMYVFGTLSYFQKEAKMEYNAFKRYGARVGWYQEWPKGFSTIIAGGYGKRFYKGKDFLGIKQERDEWNASITMWHKAIHFFGITPQFVVTYNKNDGNQPLYNSSGWNYYIDFSKTF